MQTTFKSFDSLPSDITPVAILIKPGLGKVIPSKQYEPSSPKSMTQRIWDVTVKTDTTSRWNHRPHPRTPKNRETSPHVRFIKGKFYIGHMDEPLDTLSAAKTRLKELGYLRYHWMGKLQMVG
jgi:hypothetical protein